jgi:Lipopolysaccharide-assembly
VRRRLLVLALGMTGLAGCGYSLVGKGVTTDPSIRRVGVPLFKDRSGKAGLDQKLTNKVITELLRRGRFDVVQQSEGVDATVEGEILAYNTAPIGFSSDGTTTQASRFAVTVTARIVYQKVGAKEPIWASENFQVREEAEISDDSGAFFDREEQTWDRLGEAFARNLVAAMLEAF